MTINRRPVIRFIQINWKPGAHGQNLIITLRRVGVGVGLAVLNVK